MSRFARFTLLFFVLTVLFSGLSVIGAAHAEVSNPGTHSNYANVWIEALNAKFSPSRTVREEKIIGLSNALSEIEIDTHSTDVSVVPSADENIHFILTGKTQETVLSVLQVKDLSTKIEISLSSEMTGLPSLRQVGSSIQFARENLQLQVQLPAISKISLKNKAFSGNFEAVDLTFDKLVLNSMAGDIAVTRVSANSLSATSTSGDLDSVDSEMEAVTAESTSGNLNFDSAVSNLRAESTSGDITIVRQETATPVFFEAKSASGSIGFKSLVIASGGSLHASAVSGDIGGLPKDEVVSKPGQSTAKAEIGIQGDQFTFSTVSGNIEISEEAQD